MLNAPLYELGDAFVLTGSDQAISSGNLTYQYSESSNSVFQSYAYDPYTSSSTYSENYSYSSSDGVTIDYIFSGYREEEFDSTGRLIERNTSNSSNYIELGSEVQSSSSTTTYFYSSASGYEIDYGTEVITSTYNGVVQSVNEAIFEYSYLDAPSSLIDYYQRRTSGTADNDADGIADFTYYNLETITDSSYDLVSVVFDSSSQQTSSYSSSYSQSSTGSYQYNETSAQDNDGDGIINYSYESSFSYIYDSSGSFVSSTQSRLPSKTMMMMEVRIM